MHSWGQWNNALSYYIVLCETVVIWELLWWKFMLLTFYNIVSLVYFTKCKSSLNPTFNFIIFINLISLFQGSYSVVVFILLYSKLYLFMYHLRSMLKLTTIGSDNGMSAPSHYLNQCWNIINWTLRNKLRWYFNWNPYFFIQENTFENVVCEMVVIFFASLC